MVRRRKTGGDSNKPGGSSKNRSAPKNGSKGGKHSKSSRNEPLPQDEQDLFFEGRDKILLDGSDVTGSRALEDYDNEEEVFALKGLDDSASDSEEDYDGAEDDGEDDDDDGDEPSATPPIKSSRKAKASKAKVVEEEEDEVGSEDEEEHWGKNKSAYYSATAQEIESDDEEARDLEEAEALRLQAKAREAITEDDFGLNDIQTLGAIGAPEKLSKAKPSEQAPIMPAPRDTQSILHQLERTNPEVLALAREWEDIASLMRRLEIAVEKRRQADPNHPSLGMVYLHQQTLLTYATVLAHYLHVRATPVPGPTPNAPTTARPVPDKILERLYQLKHGLGVLEDIGFSALDEGEDDDIPGQSDSESEGGSEELDYDSLYQSDEGDSFEKAEAALAELEESKRDAEALNKKRAQRLKKAAKDQAGSSSASPAKPSTSKTGKEKKSKSKDKASTSTPAPPNVTFDLVEPEFGTYSKLAKKSGSTSFSSAAPYDAFGEATSLDLPDAADKSARKKSLKFHTSRIESAARRREQARTNAMGGDDDIPWKDRRAERKKQDAAAAAAVNKTRGLGGDDLDDVDPESANDATDKGKKRARDEVDDEGEGGEGEDGYYELVKKGKKQAKIDKQAAYDAERAANKPDFAEGDTSGPRSLTRAIMKNRGLTPHRAKSVRNPRVKKKLRFEKAKKQVGSKRAVFKGGLSSLPGGRYEGERTGISQVVKSVKL